MSVEREISEPIESARLGDDAGFTIVEVILALFIIVSVMVVTLGLVISSLGTIQQSRQRQTGAALATQSLEALRALPYSTVTTAGGTQCSGKLPPDSGGTAVQLTATTDYLDTAHTYFAPAVAVVSTNGAPVTEALVKNSQSPCVANVRVDNTTFHVHQYVTSNGAAFNLTAIVTWTKSRGGNGIAVDRSTAFSPGGCLLDTLHPYSGPCQAAFVGRGSTDEVALTASSLDTTVPGATPVEIGTLTAAAVSSRVQVEQSLQVLSSLVPTGAGSGVSTPIDSMASNDPSTSAPASYGTSGAAGSAVALDFSPFHFRPTTTTSQVAGALAAAPASCALPNGSGVAQQFTTGLSAQYRPCASSAQTQSTATVVDLDAPPTAGAKLFTATNVVTSAGGAQYYDSSTSCGGTTPGCSRGVAYRSVDSLAFATWVGSGGSGLFTVSNLKEFAQSDTGASGNTQTRTRAGTLKYWDAASSSYQTVTLSATTAQTITWSGPTAVSAGDWSLAGTLSVIAGGALSGGDSTCVTSACTTTVTSGEITGDFTLTRISTGAVYPLHLAVGGVQAIAGYQKAPQ